MIDSSRSSAALDRVAIVECTPSGDITYSSPAAIDLTGVTDVSEGSSLGRLVHPDDHELVASALVDAESATTPITVWFRPRGERSDRRLAATATGTPDDGLVIQLRDVTDHWRYGVALHTLVDPSAGLFAEPSRAAIVERVTETVDAIPALTVGWYLLDTETAKLRPVPPSDGQEATIPDAVVEAARTGAITSFDPGSMPIETAVDGVAIPLGDRGVLVAGISEPQAATPLTGGFFSLLAFVVTLALDRLTYRETIEQELMARSQVETGANQLSTIVRTVRLVEQRVMDARSATSVRETLCEGLMALEPIAFVWFGQLDTEANELIPVASAGEDGGYLDAIDLRPGSDPPPGVRAAVEREPVSVPDVSAGIESAPWRRQALTAGFRSIFALPVMAQDSFCGVICCYGRSVGAFADPVGAGLSHLARTVGYVLQTLQLRSIALGATTVELVLSVPNVETPLARLAAATESVITFDSATLLPESAIRVYFTTTVAPDSLSEAVDQLGDFEGLTVVERRDDGWLYEAVIAGQSVPGTFASLGASPVDAKATADGLRVTVALPQSIDVRSFVDSVRTVYPDTELVARRTRNRPDVGSDEFRDRVRHQLTDRQQEILSAAYFGGYFEWPRDQNGSELSAELDIAQPTFSRHLRTAQRKLLELLFEGDARSLE